VHFITYTVQQFGKPPYFTEPATLHNTVYASSLLFA